MEGHPSDVASPSELPARDVDIDGLEAKGLEQGGGGDEMFSTVFQRDSAHCTRALCVEASEPLEDSLSQTPRLGSVEKNGEDESDIDSAFGARRDGLRGEDAVSQSTEGRGGLLMHMSTSLASRQSRVRTDPR